MSLWETSRFLIEFGLLALPVALVIDGIALGVAALAVILRRRG